MQYMEATAFINRFSKGGKPVSDLRRISGLMARLGNPQETLRCVHIAGTNGKGSVATYCASVLKLAGYRVGKYTSPYMEDYRDRIQVNHRWIPEEAVCRLLKKVRTAMEQETKEPEKSYSQFEMTTALAFLYFQECQCDVVCLETGIGGLLDATNVITKPLVSVITALSLDHTGILGNTLEEIAAQKAGIIKPRCPVVVTGQNPPEALQVIRETAAAKESPCIVTDISSLQNIVLTTMGSSFTYQMKDSSFRAPLRLNMVGKHQVYNALTALTAIGVLQEQGISVSSQALEAGFMSANILGRGEMMGPDVLLDGAHNPGGLQVLAELLEDCHFPHPRILFTGMLRDKDVGAALKIICPHIDRAITIGKFYPNAVGAEELAGEIRRLGVPAEPAVSLDIGLHRALALAGIRVNSFDMPTMSLPLEGSVIITGSLYLGSQIRKWFTEQKDHRL